MTELEVRKAFVDQAKAWLGYNEKNGKYKLVIDLYNTQRPLPRGYKVRYTDEWCATYVTAVGIAAGMQEIIFGECSCGKMIELYRAKGQWVENDAYVPKVGDVVMHDWQDSGKGDNEGAPDHVGIVAEVSGSSIKVIEGNKGEAVAYRNLKVNGRFIRGYCTPDFAKLADGKPQSKPQPKPNAPKEVKATGVAHGKDIKLAGTYVVNATGGLNMRHAGKATAPIMVALPYGTEVRCYGYYTDGDGHRWLYVQAIHNGIKYIGFCSSKYLKRK